MSLRDISGDFLGMRGLCYSSLVGAIVCWLVATSSTTITSLSVSVYPYFEMFPTAYWVGLCLLCLATFVWGIRGMNRRTHLVLLVLWVLYIYFGPTIMESYVRVGDTWDYLLMTNYVESARFPGVLVPLHPEYGYYYSAFPGYFYLAGTAQLITSVAYYTLAKAVFIFLQFAAVVSIMFFSRSVVEDERLAMLMSLLLVALMWYPLSDPAPSTFGSIMLVFLGGLLFKWKQSSSNRNLIALGLLYSGTLLIHGPSAYVLLVILALLAVGSYLKKNTRLRAARTYLVVFGMEFLAWVMYGSNWVLSTATSHFLLFFNTDRLASASYQFGTNLSVYRVSAIVISFAFLGILGLWFITLMHKRAFWGAKGSNVWLPVTGVASAIIAIVGTQIYVLDAPERLFIFSFPYVGWLLIAGHSEALKDRPGRRPSSRSLGTLALVFIILLLTTGFVARYSREPVLVFPNSEVRGADFLVTYAQPSASVLYDSLAPRPSALANRLPPFPTITGTTSWNQLVSGLGSATIIVISTTTIDKLTYFYGPEGTLAFTTLFSGNSSALVYDNGRFNIYL